MRFDIRLIKSRDDANAGDSSIILYLFLPFIDILVSEVKVEKRNIPRVRGCLLVCPSVADSLLAASLRSPLEQRRQPLRPLTLLAHLDGCCLAAALTGAACVRGSNR